MVFLVRYHNSHWKVLIKDLSGVIAYFFKEGIDPVSLVRLHISLRKGLTQSL
jgi:hypothetical protein